MFNAQQRNVIFIMSNCPDSQNVIKFEIEDPRSPKFAGSRWIASEPKPTPKKACILPDEMIIFSQATDATQQNLLTSYDRTFSFTRSVIDSKVYGLSNFYDFVCVPELNVFLTLNDNTNGQSEEGTKEMVIYQGGTAMKGMKRVLFRIYNLPSIIKTFQAYTHLDKVAVIFLDDNKEIVYKLNVDVNNPTLATQAEVTKENYGETLKLNIKASNPNQQVDQASGNLVILPSLGTEKPVKRGDPKQIAKGAFSINEALKMQNTPIEDCDLVADGKEVTTGQKIIGIEDSDKSALGQIDQKVGNYERFGAYDVISYFKDSSASTLEFGKLEIFEETQSNGYDSKSTLYLANTLRNTNSIVDGDYIYTAIVSNEGVGSSLKLTLAYQGTLSTKTFSIDDFNFYHRADIFLTRKLEATQAGNGQVELTIVAYCNLLKTLTAYQVTVTLDANNRLKQAPVPKQNNWTASVSEDQSTTNPTYRIQDYDFVNKGSTQMVNFYIVTEGNKPVVGRITYNKALKKFTGDDPLDTIVFETGEGKTDSQVYGIGCSRLDLDAERGNDRCAFSTYGAVVYFAEMDNTDNDPASSSSEASSGSESASLENPMNIHDGPGSGIRIEEGEQIRQAPNAVKINRMLRLRRINQNFGKNVFVLNDNVILETERVTTAQTKAALVWDVTDYKDTLVGDIGVNQVISLTQDTSKSGPQSQYDSVLVSAIPVTKEGIPVPEFDLVVLNEVKNPQKPRYNYVIGMKRLSTYILEVEVVPDVTLFNKLTVKCTSINGHVINIPVSDFLTYAQIEAKDL